MQLGSHSSTRASKRSGRRRDVSSSGDMYGLELREATYGRQWYVGILEALHVIARVSVLECSIVRFLSLSLLLFMLLLIRSKRCWLHGGGRRWGA